MLRFGCIGLMIGMLGCAGGGADPGLYARPEATTPGAASPQLRADGWFEHSLEGVAESDICLITAHALDDQEVSWLWIRLDLAVEAVVRVSGPGSLEIRLRRGDRTWTVRDLGLHVPLQSDGNTYLNSEIGPITIRAGHGLEDNGVGVRFLARLPKIDVTDVTVVSVTEVAGAWRLRP